MRQSSLTASNYQREEDPYPFTRIWINGRYVSIERIVEAKEQGETSFEERIFQFISSWISGEETFAITTSGSTGDPKNINLSRAQMVKSALLTAKAIGLRKNSTSLVCIDPKYIGGRMMLVRSLFFGLQIMAVDPTSNPLVRVPIDKCVQFTAFVPYQIESILESKHPHLLNNLDKVLIGGAPLGAATRERLDRFQCECYETYGMTETISHVALRLANTKLKQPYFEVLSGVQISKDERGCLVIKADHLEGEVVTNDIVDIVGPGKFIWLGRWDNVINTGGVKVMPEKVEQQLEDIFHRNNFNHRFFIAAIPDDKLGNKIVLVIEGVQFSSELLKRSLDELKSALSPYEAPREVYPVPRFISTQSQKIDRNQTLARVTSPASV